MFAKYAKAVFAAAILLLGYAVPASALYTDPMVINGQKIIPARSCGATQNVCYLRATINFNDNSIANGVWAFTLPSNAYILTEELDVTTAFNATSSNTLQIGATAAGADFLAATSITSTGIQHLTSAAGLGLAVTSVAGKQTAINGAVPVYFKYVQTGTAATTGVVVVNITYTKNDDK